MEEVLGQIILSPIFSAIKPSLELFGPITKIPDIDALNNVLGLHEINFVAQGKSPQSFAENYEPRIYLKREVQTREENLHDFFNALVWHRFFKTKNAINHIHYKLQESRYPLKQRLPAENMLTIFDEHGAIVLSENAELLELIREHRWHELFWLRRQQVREELFVFIFGHGLLEKALKPFIGLTTHCLLFNIKNDSCVDQVVSKFLLNKHSNLRTKDLCPLPLLGLPGWWDANEEETFYANKSYFRPFDRAKVRFFS